MKLRILALLSSVVVGIFMSSVPAHAHVLEADGGISAVLHMPPDDAPKAGEPTAVNLAFASDNPDFDISNYRIEVHVQRSDTSVQTANLQPDDGSSRDGAAIVTFPETGAYRLSVRGTANNSTDTFELNYSVRAGSGENGAFNGVSQAGFDFWVLSLGSLTLLVLVARYQIQQGGRYIRKT